MCHGGISIILLFSGLLEGIGRLGCFSHPFLLAVFFGVLAVFSFPSRFLRVWFLQGRVRYWWFLACVWGQVLWTQGCHKYRVWLLLFWSSTHSYQPPVKGARSKAHSLLWGISPDRQDNFQRHIPLNDSKENFPNLDNTGVTGPPSVIWATQLLRIFQGLMNHIPPEKLCKSPD